MRSGGSTILLRTLAVLTLAAASLALVASASGEVVSAGDLIVSFNGALSPSRLPKSTYLPVSLGLDGSFKTTDGSQLPALRSVLVRFDRHGMIDTEGLPTCAPSQLQSTLTAQAKKVCGPSLVGIGDVGAEIDFPEQGSFEATGPLLIFNAKPKHGKPALLMYVHADVPAPTTFLTEVAIEQRPSGASLSATLPSIDGGYGRISSFDFSLRRRFKSKGAEHSFVSADCPAPGGLPGAVFPLAKASYRFADGTTLEGSVLSHCQVGGKR
jgi:hypothetical protein